LEAYGAEECLLLQCVSFVGATSTAFSLDVESLRRILVEPLAILGKQGFTVETITVIGSPKHEISGSRLWQELRTRPAVRVSEVRLFASAVRSVEGWSVVRDEMFVPESFRWSF